VVRIMKDYCLKDVKIDLNCFADFPNLLLNILKADI